MHYGDGRPAEAFRRAAEINSEVVRPARVSRRQNLVAAQSRSSAGSQVAEIRAVRCRKAATLVLDTIRTWLRHGRRVGGEILYGMSLFDWTRGVRRQRSEVEQLFMLTVFGDLIGLPILPPYYALRLVPYVVPLIDRWKRSLLRERDWTDLAHLVEGVD